MKDIGELFKETRETIGINLEEASNDLGLTIAQLENLEDGNANAFKDVFFLKETIKKYTKYLNIKEDLVMEEFNDFMFNYTSKIPIAKIEEKVKEIQKEEKADTKKISSPYTMKNDIKHKVNPIIIYVISVVILVSVAVILINLIKEKSNNESLSYNMLKGVDCYECSK